MKNLTTLALALLFTVSAAANQTSKIKPQSNGGTTHSNTGTGPLKMVR
jgi:hypothetical protein